MPVSIFLSHNKADKPFTRRLARDLENQGLRVWLDEAEIKIGESLIEKIRDGIDGVDFVAVILSPESVTSPWVQREVDVAMNQEIAGRRVKVLPIMYRKCDLPGFLLGKAYADFTTEENCEAALEKLVRDVGVVFNRSAVSPSTPESHLGRAINSAMSVGLRTLPSPFHRPFQYMGLTIADAAQAVGGQPNDAGNIVVDSDECRMFLEAEGNFIKYIDVELKQTAPHYLNQEFDSEAILGALSINPSELELIRKQTHYHTYYDHRKKLKVGVSCIYDGAPLSVGFSGKYYGM